MCPVARQVRSTRLPGGGRPFGSALLLGRFAGFFVGSLFDVFVRSKLDA